MEQQVVLRTREMQLIEAEFGQPIEELLRQFYVDEGLDIVEVGIRLGGLNKGTISRWLAHFRIPTRRGGTLRRGPRKAVIA